MGDRQYDIIVFGATGFTGKRVCKEIVESGFSGSFALAARDQSKLRALASALGRPCGIIVADVSSPSSISSMVRQGRVLINTVGPFRYYGEPVVQACIEARCDYLDVCGEPEYIERIEYDYNQKAKEAGVYIASAVGFDSVPGDLGTQWTMSLFEPPARCTVIETFLTIRGGPSGFKGHYPTFLSAVEGFASARELSALRKRVQAQTGKVDLKIPGPKPRRQTGPSYDSRVKAWTFPFMGADASVVKRTIAANLQDNTKPAAHCAIYVTIPSRFFMFLFVLFGSVFSFLAKQPWGRRLLTSYPRLFSFGMFSHDGPSEQQMKDTVFYMTNIAQGYSSGGPSSLEEKPDMTIITRVTGPEPGYISCSIFIVAAAVVVLSERDELGVEPGVHTPARLLQHSKSYLERLKRRGIGFERIDNPRVY